ncbi:hypothetical protein [Cetobacterium sp.]|uniref:hypothetical protein n=1 Tax=Cetobacterium sp. TaxID=2071632 RepID=UPI003F3079D0
MILENLKKNNREFLSNCREIGIFKAIKIEIRRSHDEMQKNGLDLGKLNLWAILKFLIIGSIIAFAMSYFAFLYIIIGFFLLRILAKFLI